MMRSHKVIMVFAIVGVVAFVIWKTTSNWWEDIAISAWADRSARGTVSNSVDFVRSHVTGGIGVAVAMDSRTGLPVVGALRVDSPAQREGVRVGDVIIKVNGIGTTGLALTQIVEQIKGISVGSVMLTTLRHGTNIDFEIKRSSWNALKDKSFNPYE